MCLVLIRRALLERARQSTVHPTASGRRAAESSPSSHEPQPQARLGSLGGAAITRSASANFSATPLLRDFGPPAPRPADEPTTPEADYDNLLALPKGRHGKGWWPVAITPSPLPHSAGGQTEASPQWGATTSEELPAADARPQPGEAESAASLARRRWQSGAGRLRRGPAVDGSADEIVGVADAGGGEYGGERGDVEAAGYMAQHGRRDSVGSRFRRGAALGAAPSTALFGDVRFSPSPDSGDKWGASDRSSRLSVSEVRNRRSLSRRRLFLVYTAFSSGLGFAVCFAIAFFRDMSGPVAELVFLDTCLSRGEGFVLCLIFGFDPGVKAWFGRIWTNICRMFASW